MMSCNVNPNHQVHSQESQPSIKKNTQELRVTEAYSFMTREIKRLDAPFPEQNTMEYMAAANAWTNSHIVSPFSDGGKLWLAPSDEFCGNALYK